MSKSWLSSYIYYAGSVDELLIKAVKPFVQMILGKGLAENYFFIRYWERGSHIRLRFKGETRLIEDVLKPELESYFKDYFKQNPSERIEPSGMRDLPEEQQWLPNDSVQFIDYEPEIERYGGLEGILVSERQFEFSSQSALKVIGAETVRNYESAIGKAIQMHLALSYAFDMSIDEMICFYSLVVETWLPKIVKHSFKFTENENREEKEKTLGTLEESFIRLTPNLIPIHEAFAESVGEEVCFGEEWLDQWIRDMKIVASDLKALQKESKLKVPVFTIVNPCSSISTEKSDMHSLLTSYVHMTNNRLGVKNFDESYIGYLIKRSLEVINDKHCV